MKAYLSPDFPMPLTPAPVMLARGVPQSGDQGQDFGEQPAGHRDLGELEGDVAAVTDDLRADFDQLFAQAGHGGIVNLCG